MSKCTDVSSLQSALLESDCLAKEGFSCISAMASAALVMMEQPATHRHPKTLAQPLLAIERKANEAQDSINHRVELLGCRYMDEAAERRCSAASEARGEK